MCLWQKVMQSSTKQIYIMEDFQWKCEVIENGIV